MVNIHTHIPHLTPGEFASIRGEIERAVESTGGAEHVGVLFNEAQQTVQVRIQGLRIESGTYLNELLDILGQNAELEIDNGGPGRGIAA